jgi:hypothetical protein
MLVTQSLPTANYGAGNESLVRPSSWPPNPTTPTRPGHPNGHYLNTWSRVVVGSFTLVSTTRVSTPHLFLHWVGGCAVCGTRKGLGGKGLYWKFVVYMQFFLFVCFLLCCCSSLKFILFYMFFDIVSLRSIFTLTKTNNFLFFSSKNLFIFKNWNYRIFHDLLLCYCHIISEINPECNLW